MKRIIAITLALTLSLCCLTAARASILSLDESYSGWLEPEGSTVFSAGFSVESLMPFGEDQLDLINDAMKHVRLDARLSKGGGAYRLLLGDNALFSAREQDGALETDLLPGTVLSGEGVSAMLLLSGSDIGENEHIEPFVLLDAELEREEAVNNLMSALEGVWEEKPSKYKIKSVATSEYSRVIKLTQEQCDEYTGYVTSLLACGMDAEHRDFLAGCTLEKNITVAVYTDGEHVPMATYVKGNMSAASGVMYSIDYKWGFTRGKVSNDNYTYTLKSKSGKADNRAITATRKHEQNDSALTVTAKTTTTLKKAAVTEKTISTVSAKGKKSGTETTFEGKFIVDLQVKSTGSVRTVKTITPSLKVKDSALSGSISVETTKDKKPQTALTITLSSDTSDGFSAWAAGDEFDEPSSEGDPFVVVMDEHGEVTQPEALPTPEPVQKKEISVEALSESDRAALIDMAHEQLGARLITALYALPEEDRALLIDGLTQEDIDALYALLEAL